MDVLFVLYNIAIAIGILVAVIGGLCDLFDDKPTKVCYAFVLLLCSLVMLGIIWSSYRAGVESVQKTAEYFCQSHFKPAWLKEIFKRRQVENV